ncbi:MAG: heavy metal translocating P-type ATPase [Rhodocyclaceae bacterium]|nr:heavy metal translocating P-type ATPase [Rhodocyclaceae bacterium]
MAHEESCYHCGLPIPAGVDFVVEIDGAPRRMCCAGCEAVATAIVANGLADYYRHRDALPESPREALPLALSELGLFDRPEVQKNFVRPIGEHEAEASLILEGITCAACVWLNETHLARQPGVTAVDINYATRRARVRWDTRITKLSDLLAAIQAIGYRAHPYDATRAEALARKERRAALWRLFVAGFGMMQVMMYAVPVYLASDDMPLEIEQLMRWASLVLTLPVMVYSAAPFFVSALRDLKWRRIGMDVPVALGLASAFLASVWATLTASGEVYFDSVTMFVFFLLSGRYLEMMARQKAVRGVEELAKIMPTFAERLSGWRPAEATYVSERVAVADLAVDDVVRVKPGETVPGDGVVLEGRSSCDESLLTGESRPIAKAPGDAVIGGSVNVESPLIVRLTRVGEATRLASIRRLMEEAAAEKPRLVVLADRVAARFVGALLLLAAVTAAYWWHADPSQALWIFVAVLVVSCPCALSLATPAALTVATGSMARLGVLITRGHAIETLARADHWIFDKTGTLTVGRPTVVDMVIGENVEPARVQGLVRALEAGSEHPLARALQEKVGAGEAASLTDLLAVTGQGLEAREKTGRRVRIGAPDFVAALHAQPMPAQVLSWRAQGETVVALGDEEGWLAWFRLADALRAEAKTTIDALRKLGVQLTILSGDAPATVAVLAQELGIADFHGAQTPEQKHAFVKTLQQQGKTVAMVGDGVNDAPVLAQAHVSIALGTGAELARAHADIVLLSHDLTRLAAAVRLARRTLSIVRQNLLWAFAYNITAIPLAMAGLVTPWLAGIGMSASSLLVVVNALRLQKKVA